MQRELREMEDKVRQYKGSIGQVRYRAAGGGRGGTVQWNPSLKPLQNRAPELVYSGPYDLRPTAVAAKGGLKACCQVHL